MPPDPILEVENLSVSFVTDSGRASVVEEVSFAIQPGETVGLVGESGCGKSVTAMSIMRLIPSPPSHVESGRILFQGDDLLTLDNGEMRAVRGDRIGMIFQEPMTSLNPTFSIGYQIAEVCLANSYYVYKSPLFHRLVNPGGNGTIWVHA